MNREFERPITIERREPSKEFSLTFEGVRRVTRENEDKKRLVIPIFRKFPSDLDTPVKTYLKLSKERKQSNFSPSFLMEGVTRGEDVGRWSYLCFDSGGGISVTVNEISELGPDGRIISTKSGERIDPLEAIKEGVSKEIANVPGVPPFIGGKVGFLAYDAVGAFEPRLLEPKPDQLGIPRAMFFDFNKIIAFDHARNELMVVGSIHVDDPKGLERQYEDVTAEIDETVKRIIAKETTKTKAIQSKKKVGKEIRSNFTDEGYRAVVETTKEYLKAGDAIQVVISQRLERETDVDGFTLYRALRKENPSPYMFYGDLGSFQIVSASPELQLQVQGRKVTMHPIAGTRPRGDTDEDDLKLEEELKTSEKQRAEHIMLVDLGRNDVGRVCKPGTVKVTKLMEVLRLARVMHLASEIVGILRDGLHPLDALRASFPAGTVSGAPKIRAMEIIRDLEQTARNLYAGALGYISFNGDFKMAIAIRTMLLKNGIVYAQSGGGIVFDSDPEDERLETMHKASATIRAIDSAEKEY